MKYAILCALDLEFRALLRQCPGYRMDQMENGIPVAIAPNGSYGIVKTGVGNENSGRCARQIAVQYPMIKGLVSTGVAGSLCDEIPVGAVTVSEAVITYADGKVSSYCSPKQTMDWLEDCLKRTCEPLFWGPLLSSDQFIADAALRNSLYRNCQTLCVEMESQGILDVCNEYDLSFLAVKAISDMAQGEGSQSADLLHALRAADQVAGVLIRQFNQR